MAQVAKGKKLKICYIPYYGYEVNNVAFADKYKRRWTNILKDKLEKDGHSIATYDINTIEDSDYIISFDNTYFQNVRHFWNIWKVGKLGRTLHIDYEPPSAMIRIHSDRGLRLLSKLFTIMTYNDNVVNGKSIIKGVVGDYHEEERVYRGDLAKRKLLCMVANNRTKKIPIKRWPGELYTAREAAAAFFSKRCPNDFDLYGDYWPTETNSKGVLDRDKKLDTIAKYRFVVSYDSITNQNGYISEKIFDIFTAKAVPIYWGADNVTHYIPEECFIDRRQFSSEEAVLSYIKKMTKKEYEDRIGAIEKYLASDQYKKIFSSEAIADAIIEKFIYREPRHISRIVSFIILVWFTYIYRTNSYYSYDNYFYDSAKKSLRDPIYYVDKGVSNKGPVFVAYANIRRAESMYVAMGERRAQKVESKLVATNGVYDTVSLEVPYADIVEHKKVGLYVKGKEGLVQATLNHANLVNKTNYDDSTGFRVVGNCIVSVKRSEWFMRKAKRMLKRAKEQILPADKPEIIYYPFIAEPTIVNDTPFSLDGGNHSWEQQLRIIANKHGIEVHTPDTASYKNVIGVLFFDNMFYHNLPALKDLHQRDLLRKTIYIDYEPPTGHAKKHEPESIRELSGLFKGVVTYDDDLAGTGNFIKGNVANFYGNQVKEQSFAKKGFAIMITNNTTPDMIIHSLNYWNNTDYYSSKNIKYHPKAIYHKRFEVVDFFYNNYPSDLALYGTGFPEKYNGLNKGYLNRAKKIDTMSKYKFTIAFDSYTDQNGYISEKIFDAFFAKTVPVYLGANNVLEYIPKQCFVDARDFSSYDDLYDYLKSMSKEEYDKRISAIEGFLKSDVFNKFFSSEAIAEDLYSAITSPDIVPYDKPQAQKILATLESEKNRLNGPAIITPRIDKKQIDGRWCFVISVKPPVDNGGSLDGKIYAMANGEKIHVATHNDKHPELDGNTCMIVPYEEAYSRRALHYFVDLGKGKHTKLIFSSHVRQLINKTHYDDGVVFSAKGNTIMCTKVDT